MQNLDLARVVYRTGSGMSVRSSETPYEDEDQSSTDGETLELSSELKFVAKSLGYTNVKGRMQASTPWCLIVISVLLVAVYGVGIWGSVSARSSISQIGVSSGKWIQIGEQVSEALSRKIDQKATETGALVLHANDLLADVSQKALKLKDRLGNEATTFATKEVDAAKNAAQSAEQQAVGVVSDASHKVLGELDDATAEILTILTEAKDLVHEVNATVFAHLLPIEASFRGQLQTHMQKLLVIVTNGTDAGAAYVANALSDALTYAVNLSTSGVSRAGNTALTTIQTVVNAVGKDIAEGLLLAPSPNPYAQLLLKQDNFDVNDISASLQAEEQDADAMAVSASDQIVSMLTSLIQKDAQAALSVSALEAKLEASVKSRFEDVMKRGFKAVHEGNGFVNGIAAKFSLKVVSILDNASADIFDARQEYIQSCVTITSAACQDASAALQGQILSLATRVGVMKNTSVNTDGVGKDLDAGGVSSTELIDALEDVQSVLSGFQAVGRVFKMVAAPLVSVHSKVQNGVGVAEMFWDAATLYILVPSLVVVILFFLVGLYTGSSRNVEQEIDTFKQAYEDKDNAYLAGVCAHHPRAHVLDYTVSDSLFHPIQRMWQRRRYFCQYHYMIAISNVLFGLLLVIISVAALVLALAAGGLSTAADILDGMLCGDSEVAKTEAVCSEVLTLLGNACGTELLTSDTCDGDGLLLCSSALGGLRSSIPMIALAMLLVPLLAWLQERVVAHMLAESLLIPLDCNVMDSK